MELEECDNNDKHGIIEMAKKKYENLWISIGKMSIVNL